MIIEATAPTGLPTVQQVIIPAQPPSFTRHKLKLIIPERLRLDSKSLPPQQDVPIPVDTVTSPIEAADSTMVPSQTPVVKKLWNIDPSARKSSDKYHISILSTHLVKRKRIHDENCDTDPPKAKRSKTGGDLNVPTEPYFLPQFPFIRMEVC